MPHQPFTETGSELLLGTRAPCLLLIPGGNSYCGVLFPILQNPVTLGVSGFGGGSVRRGWGCPEQDTAALATQAPQCQHQAQLSPSGLVGPEKAFNKEKNAGQAEENR